MFNCLFVLCWDLGLGFGVLDLRFGHWVDEKEEEEDCDCVFYVDHFGRIILIDFGARESKGYIGKEWWSRVGEVLLYSTLYFAIYHFVCS